MPQRRKGVRLYLRKRKGREAEYIIRDGTRQISTGCGVDESERASEVLSQYLAARFKPDTSQKRLDAIPVSEVLMLYAQDLPADSPSRALRGYHIQNLLRFWGDKTLADVKGSTCRKYLLSRCSQQARSVSPSTVRGELKTLQTAINHWHRESPLEAVPKVTLPEPGGRRERFLERHEAAALLRAARRLGHTHVARFILIGLYTGTRHNAILSIKWGSNLHGGHIDFQRGVLFRRGSAEKDTSKRRPPVACPRRLLSHLARWRGMDEPQFSNSPVIHYHGQRILKMKRAWSAVVKEAGLGKDVTPHVLRHTCATWLLWQGKTIWDVAGIIGADASTVERVYGHHRRIEEERKRA